ncbi:hypothetical protein [Aquimarina sp. MMG016]|uniref:hypothetical protein n=1 Tax=Aquimarina sp. MMG016 TaxID=2822690 RepID=UPI001B3A1616|nr:hypothetical protein [Aquimarina sp. MMG016]MBQ4821364.1 hypothetical protein [Aquimarina sp. MMG016]
MITTEVKQKIQLVEGKFTPSEAQDIVSALIEEKVNFHKLQRLSLCEGEEGINTTYDDSRIKELYVEKRIAKEFITNAREEGFNVRINGILEITFER